MATDTVGLNINETRLDKAITAAFVKNGKSQGTKAVVIVHQGKIVREVYNNSSFAHAYGLSDPQDDIGPNTPLLGWSMTKSITNAILGAMIHQGKFGDFGQFSRDRKLIDAGISNCQIIEEFLKTIKIKDYLDYPSLHDPNLTEDITMNDLLQMTSGFEWGEFWESLELDVFKMVYRASDMAAYVAGKKRVSPPGQGYNYSSGDTNLICAVMKACFLQQSSDGLKAYWEFPHQYLFDPMGMCNTILQVDLSGTFVGSSYCIASARDWSRFGLLFLNGGMIKNSGQVQPLLPAGWVDYSKSMGQDSNGKVSHYGAHFWLNRSTQADLEDGKAEIGIEGVGQDMYYARGLFGQRVYIVPEQELVVVRIGTKDKIGLKGLLSEVVHVFKQAAPS